MYRSDFEDFRDVELKQRLWDWISQQKQQEDLSYSTIQAQASIEAIALNMEDRSISYEWVKAFCEEKNIQIPKKTIEGRLIIATRLHEQEATRKVDLKNVESFCNNVAPLSDEVVIAVDTGGVHGIELTQNVQLIADKFSNVMVLPISYWGKFCPALNAIVSYASRTQTKRLIFQSLEVSLTQQVIKTLCDELHEDDLVVGAEFQGHEFKVGDNEINGCTSPWNTLAVWSAVKIAQTGFLLIADGAVDGIEGGIEEVAAISLLQKLQPQTCQAKLLRIPGINWATNFTDPQRQKWHDHKMASKKKRANRHLSHLGLSPGKVIHINM